MSPKDGHHSHRFCVAPMIDWTDRYCRWVHRLLSAKARLYTEMVVDEAILHGDRDRLLGFDSAEHPVALQIGGSDPRKLAEVAAIGAQAGYDEINLNVGCPSDRVQSGRFGACLMAEPETVAEGVRAMAAAVPCEVTVKCRIGIDDQSPEEALPRFLDAVEAAGVRTVIVHARKAWLEGLSPKENRTIPPLDYDLVVREAQRRPALSFILNGGLAGGAAAERWLTTFPGVMLGRAAYEQPFLLSEVDQRLFGAPPAARSRLEIVEAVADRAAAEAVPIWRYARHMLGLYHGQPGAKTWRRQLSEEGRSAKACPAWLVDVAETVSAKAEAPDRAPVA
ncbi:NifR3/Smm1 family protein [Parvularcula bermudensis HTCC2503]|uniref:tRNA-dihydrouridine(20/20a) synthase n=1 Tax=Parvularcula bermudensis (strain ATCC BAA-594 / HTCC2503 / KCTC 12087) TaxID=314260 RepID=E0TB92_PARBH|nr:tRNA dihydrouridine(20/20a) synthase DusA [Parvularcula bermudensis]ADM08296.1 NifR3/Smm1 family protein [Parvularcula bermudensis HTCC2503]